MLKEIKGQLAIDLNKGKALVFMFLKSLLGLPSTAFQLMK